jgi:hypothetical protein
MQRIGYFSQIASARYCRLAWFVASFMLVVLTACATGSKLTDHSFGFDMRESPDAMVLDYRYGESVMTRAPTYALKEGTVPQVRSINGPIPRGDTLYVKWRIKSTGAVYEDTVDLRNRLPADITHHRIHFVIRGPQLYVYLISPEKRPVNWPTGPLRMYSDLKVVTIYPNN